MKNSIIEIINSNDFNKEDKNIFLKTFSYEQREFIVKNFIEIFTSTFYLKGYKFFNENEIEGFYNDNKERLFKYPSYDLMLSSFFGVDFFQLVDDDSILKLIQKEDNHLFKRNLAYHLQSDKNKLVAIKKNIIDNKSLLLFISLFESDNEKIKLLYILPEHNKIDLLSMIKDDDLKVRNIFKNKGYYGLVIASIENNGLKDALLGRYLKFISSREKAFIIASFNEYDYIKKNMRLLQKPDEIYSFLLSFKPQGNELDIESIIIDVLNKVYSEDYLCKIIKDCEFLFKDRPLLLCQQMLRIRNSNHLVDILENLGFDFYKNYLHLFIGRIDEASRLQILNSIGGKYALKYYQYLPSTRDISVLINTSISFPMYNPRYDDLINRYAQIYHVDINNLKDLIIKTDLSVLKYLDNNNLKELLNLEASKYNKIVDLIFDNVLLTDDAANNVINSLLQRKFKIQNQDIINIFGNFLVAIENQDVKRVTELLFSVSKKIDLSKYINADINVFINDLLNKDEVALDLLHGVVNKYIILKSNEFIKNNISASIDFSHDFRMSKKNMYKTFNLDRIYEVIDPDELSIKESTLFTNKSKMQAIYDYKLGKKDVSILKDDEKIFNTIFDKYYNIYWHNYCRTINNGDNLKQQYKLDRPFYDYIDNDEILDILMNINVKKIKNDLIDNEEKFNCLKKYASKYKIFGWTTGLKKIAKDVNTFDNPSLLGSLVTYFNEIYDEIYENFNFTTIMDFASCYLSSAKTYEQLLGKDNAHFIISNPVPNASIISKEERLNLAINDLKDIRNRKFITIPSFEEDYKLSNGKLININVGNFSNPINLTYGERTGSCMRTGNTGSSLYNFCLKNINGFHIRFSNPDNNSFISRVSGFRNGNTVFLNDLRDSINSEYFNSDLVEAVKYTANKIIESTKAGKYPIKNVIISKNHAMENNANEVVRLNVDSVTAGLGDFYTDIGSHGIVLATVGNKDSIDIELDKNKINLYRVLREKPRIYYDTMARNMKIHMDFLNDFENGVALENIHHLENSKIKLCYAGEDWYIAIYENGNVETKLFDKSKDNQEAINEMIKVIEKINDIQHKDYLVKQYERKKNDWHSN